MKTKRILKILREVRRTEELKTAAWAKLQIKEKLPFFKEGETIEQVTQLWRETWVLARLDEAISLLMAGSGRAGE